MTYIYPHCSLRVQGYSLNGKPIDWHLQSGEQISLRGANGSGKTTVLQAIAGLGDNRLGETDQSKPIKRFWCDRLVDDPDPEFQSQVLWFGHRNGLRGELSIREDWHFWQKVLGSHLSSEALSKQDIADRLGLGVSLERRIQNLSAGEAQKVALARLFFAKRPLWILDEPDSHLDAESRENLQDWFAQHRNKGGMIIEASHFPKAAGQIWDLD